MLAAAFGKQRLSHIGRDNSQRSQRKLRTQPKMGCATEERVAQIYSTAKARERSGRRQATRRREEKYRWRCNPFYYRGARSLAQYLLPSTPRMRTPSRLRRRSRSVLTAIL